MEQNNRKIIEETVDLIGELEGRIEVLNDLINGIFFLKNELKAKLNDVENAKTQEEIKNLMKTINGILSKYPYIEKHRVKANKVL